MTTVGARNFGLLLATAIALSGCSHSPRDDAKAGSTAATTEGSCTVRVRFHSHVYRAVSTSKVPDSGRWIGRAPYADCDGTVAPEMGTARLWNAGSMDPAEVLLVKDPVVGHPVSVYVLETLRPSDWPEQLQTIANP
jgi:hypothetical protein